MEWAIIIKGKNSSNENIDRMHTRTFSQPHSGGVVILCETGIFFSQYFIAFHPYYYLHTKTIE